MYYLEEFYKERYCGRKPAIFWLVFFSYMCIINMYESVRQVHKMDYTVLDLEMTGLAPKRDKVIEIGAVRVRNGEIADTYGTLVRPGMSIPETVVQLTGITDEMAALGKEENVAMQELLQFIGDDILVGHNLIFDYSFLKQWAVNQKIPLELSACDTLRIARALLPGAQSKKLESLCEYFQIEREHAHRALDDAVETYKVFENLKSIEGASMELFVPKPLVYKAKRQTPATEHQKERLRELMEQYGRKDSISWETLTRSEASRLQDKIRAGNFLSFSSNDFLRKRRKLRSCFLQLQDSGEIAPGLIDGCQLCVDAAVVDMTGNCKFQQLACLIGISGITQFLGIDGSISFKCGKTVITCAEFIQVCNTIFKFQVGVTHGRKIQHFLTA